MFPDNTLNLSNAEYLQSLIIEKPTETIDDVIPSKVVCMAKLKNMSLSDQIQIILRDSNN